ncbi:MAG: PIN domain-containing protein [bacterium]
MESVVYLDTHVVVWLYSGDMSLLSKAAIQAIEKDDLLISPAVELELQYLLETDRITVPPHEIINSLAVDVGLRKCNQHFATVITHAVQIQWTRDPFDRLIVGQAAIQQMPLLTKDRSILSNYSMAFWTKKPV